MEEIPALDGELRDAESEILERETLKLPRGLHGEVVTTAARVCASDRTLADRLQAPSDRTLQATEAAVEAPLDRDVGDALRAA